jgi:hypothetical protein
MLCERQLATILHGMGRVIGPLGNQIVLVPT